MYDDIHKLVFEQTPNGVGICSIIFEEEQPIDFNIKQSNASLCRLLQIQPENLSRMKGLDAFCVPEELRHKWRDEMAGLKSKSRCISLPEILNLNDHYYRRQMVKVDDKDFILILTDITLEQHHNDQLERMLIVTEEFLKFTGSEMDYQKICDQFLSLCNAKHVVFNLFEASGLQFYTQAISSDQILVKMVSKMLGFNLLGKKWAYDPVYFEKIRPDTITYFDGLKDIIGDLFPNAIIYAIDKIANVGQVVVLKITRDNRILGEFTVFMNKRDRFEEAYYAEIYTNQVGLLLSRFQSEKALEAEKVFLETTLMSIGDGVISIDDTGEVMFMNHVAEELIGWRFEEVKGSIIERIFRAYDNREGNPIPRYMTMILNGDLDCIIKHEALIVAKNGEEISIEYSLSPMITQRGEFIGTVLVFRDFRDQLRKQEEIGFLSYHDQLTGLYNRRFYDEELPRLDHARNLPISIVMGDVNGLKLINDSFGHSFGDELLVKVTKAFQMYVPDNGFVARLGGDEFVVVMPNADEKDAQHIIELIRQTSAMEHVQNTPISISFGYGTKHEMNEPLSDVIRIAEDFMYRHKLYESSSVRSRTIDLIMETLYAKNQREMNHSKRVSDLARRLAESMGFSKEQVHAISLAGLMHDIGKIGIEEQLLNKPGKLSDDEWMSVRRHSEIGYRILTSVNEFSEIANYVLEHHERLDGTGYPRGLSGEGLSVQGRIIAVADAFDAMTNQRTYGIIKNKKNAYDEIANCTPSQFDPQVVKVLGKLIMNENGNDQE